MYKVANAPCSWGVIENTSGSRPDYATVLDEMQATGYLGTELGDWGFMPTNPEKLAAELESLSLELVASWVDVDFHKQEKHAQDEEKVLQIAHLLAAVAGETGLVVLGNNHSSVPVRAKNAGRIMHEHGLGAEGWKVFAEGVNRIAHAVREQTGLRSVIHHHCATWIETPEETATILQLTDPDVVGLCFDTGHYRFGGGDSLAGLDSFSDRVWHVHFKDCDPEIAARSRREGWDYNQSVGNGVFCELGKGDVDFPAILAKLREVGYQGWIVVEQDILPGMGSPKESAQRNRDYLRSIGL